MSLVPLPTATDAVRAPRWFSASRLGLARTCPFALALAESDDRPPSLPPHPKATFGTILHDLHEAAARGHFRSPSTFPAEARAFVAGRVEALDPAIPSPQAVYGAMAWRQRVAAVVAGAKAFVEDGRPQPPARGTNPQTRARGDIPTGPPPYATRGDGRWPEQWLASPRLRVRGKADLVERRGDRVTITDLKTGAASSSESAVSPSTALQLRAYGLIVAESLPAVQIDLVVSSTVARPVSFGPAERAAALETLASLDAALPTGQEVSVDVATPGPACRFCSRRHRCSAYRERAPSWWADGAPHPIPLDVWGHVEEVAAAASSTSLQLRDAAGRRVRIARLRSALVPDVRTGDAVGAFGLRGRGHRTEDGAYVAPVHYADLDADGQTAAWTLALYGDGG